MSSKSKVTSRQSENSRFKAGQTSLVAAAGKAAKAKGQQDDDRFRTVVGRLRASQDEHDEYLQLSGHFDGQAWAESVATAPELRRLKQARDPWGSDWYFGVGSSAYSDAERFFFIVRPKFDGDRALAEEFWEDVTGVPQTPETAYIQAFAEGAMKIWDEFEDQI